MKDIVHLVYQGIWFGFGFQIALVLTSTILKAIQGLRGGEDGEEG
jgi:hypothetical protein